MRVGKECLFEIFALCSPKIEGKNFYMMHIKYMQIISLNQTAYVHNAINSIKDRTDVHVNQATSKPNPMIMELQNVKI